MLSTMALSPDAQRVAYGRRDATGAIQKIWVTHLTRGVSSPLTFGATFDSDAAWSPDGKEIAFASIRSGRKSLYAMSSTGGRERTLLASTGPTLSMDTWAPDGRFVLYHIGTTRELMALSMTGQSTSTVVVRPNTGVVDEPSFSPDGRWVAYNTNDAGRHEVYIKSFPPTDAQWQISISGGVQPRWRGDGRELFFLAPDGTMMAVDIRAGSVIEAGVPRPLFPTGLTVNALTDQYAVMPDGSRFLIMRPLAERPRTLSFSAILNWRSLPGS
jgi:Tol biopolymer transport system component